MDNEQTVEELRAAADTMLAAANRFKQAADLHDSSLSSFMGFMDGWMTRLESVVTALTKDRSRVDNEPPTPPAIVPVPTGPDRL